jgi:hypothetical protein
VSKSKVVAMSRDISKPGLANNVSVMFLAAAIINFNGPLLSAINTNLLGTKRVLQLCHHMQKIKVRRTFDTVQRKLNFYILSVFIHE